MKWKPAIFAPRDAFGLVVAIRFTCSCAAGGITLVMGGRLNGNWVFNEEIEHSFDITHFMELPKPPDSVGKTVEHRAGHC